MKKIFSIILCLLLFVSLTITAFAADTRKMNAQSAGNTTAAVVHECCAAELDLAQSVDDNFSGRNSGTVSTGAASFTLIGLIILVYILGITIAFIVILVKYLSLKKKTETQMQPPAYRQPPMQPIPQSQMQPIPQSQMQPIPQPKKFFCNNCGNPIDPTDIFCPGCGSRTH